MRRAARGIHAWRGSTAIVTPPVVMPMVMSPPNRAQVSRYADGNAFAVSRRSTPCVDAFRGDNRHAAMRLRYGFNAGQNPARVNAASPDTCAALRAASTHGVDLRDCYVADRCFDGYVAAKPGPGFRDTPIEMPMVVSRIDTRIVTSRIEMPMVGSPINPPMVGSPLNAPMVMSPIDMPTVTSPINMPSAACPINTPVAHRSPPCNLGKAQYPHAARPRRRATGSRRPGPDQTPQWPARSDPMRSRSTKRYFQQLFALYAGLVGAR